MMKIILKNISPLTRDGLLLVAVVALGQVGVEVRDVVVVPGVASNAAQHPVQETRVREKDALVSIMCRYSYRIDMTHSK